MCKIYETVGQISKESLLIPMFDVLTDYSRDLHDLSTLVENKVLMYSTFLSCVSERIFLQC